MKRRFSKILGVGLSLALLTSLLLTAAPVSALSQPSVTVTPTTISATNADYAIRFELDKQLTSAESTVSSGVGAYMLFDIDDSFVITATGAGTATITEDANDAVSVALSGGATLVSYTGGPTGGVHTILFVGTNDTATVTGLTADPADGLCEGNWALPSATATATITPRTDDTITIVFQSDTTITTTTPTATLIAGPGWINGIWEDATTTTVTAAGTVDTRTVVITLDGTNTRIGEGAEVRISITAGITNPSSSGNYTLTVETSKEDTPVTSAPYAIEVPTIPGLPGVANVYNPVGILMAQKNDLSDAVDAAGVDYTIQVGPGTYIDNITIGYEGLTFVSTAGAAYTIIEGTITINAIEVTVDGFTVEVTSGCAISVTGAATDAIVQNNIITAEDGWPEGINLGATGATVSGNELSINTTMMVIGATDCTLSDNTFGAGINVQGSTGIDIIGNDLTGSEFTGIVFESSASTDILIEGNTISGIIDAEGTGIRFKTGGTGIQIIGNDITDNEGEAITVDSTVTLTDAVIKFNTITGNNIETGDYAILNDGVTALDATFNWWGTDVAADIADMVSGDDVTYEPFLTGTAEAVLSASDAGTGLTLDAKDTVGVKVSVANADATPAPTITVSKYTANPEEAISGAIAFFDVYVAGVTATASTDDPDPAATIKFYAGDAQTDVYLWSADTETWGEVTPVDFSAYGGYVYVTVETAMLDGTPFALVAGVAAAIGIPEILTPTTGDDTVSLTPIFAWEAVTDAAGYYFELADNANFVVPMVSLTGDLGRLVVTAYAYVEELPYSKAYYWRVKAVSGTVEAGDLGEGAWASGVFITMAEPEEEAPPIVVEEVQPPVIVVEQPDIIVPLPAETAITPAWIYVIIGVGAVLVIALLVLIVRTRRVA